MNRYKLFLAYTFLLYTWVNAQQGKNPYFLKDSVDKKFDLSDYIIDANGFVPVPYILTEPALGGFGGALIPVFIKKRPPYLDSVKGKLIKTPVPPDITGGGLFYTLNNTWLVMGFRSGTFIKSRIKYTAGGGYANINMSFYKTLPQLGEKEFKFNIQTIPVLLQATKRISVSRWFAGLKYIFLKSDITYEGDASLEQYTDSLDFNKVVSQLGAIVEFDNRDNIFTPDKGIKFHVDCLRSDDIFGSDYDFWRLNYYSYMYWPFSRTITGGLRIDGQQTFEDVPFYMKPYIDLRGIPIYRYQGDASILSEFEMRCDIKRRWSLMLYAGSGKAFDEWTDFGNTNWAWSYGTGFRYLLARKFKLRVGIDVAKGPDNWAYYIVFGSNWLD